MIKNILLVICFLWCTVAGYSQFVVPTRVPEQNCHVNVNASSDFRDDIKRAVFRLNTGFGNCSATLINRNTSSQSEVGQYFISAWHCFKSGTNCGTDNDEGEFDWANTQVTLSFNYQSPDGQSLVYDQNNNGQAYQIRRRVRLVEKISCGEGDFALCEILGDPIPPYFNVYYAGWYPNELGINNNGAFSTIHHPAGSIKKISDVDHLVPPVNIVKETCISITKVIDVLLGWIWKRKWSTQVICSYAQIPFYGTKYQIVRYNNGVVEDGSSGGGLFTGDRGFSGANRIIGQLSATAPNYHCNPTIDVGSSYFGKFADAYYRQSVKNTLNPQNDLWVDQGGMGGLQITCYPEITINGGPDIHHPVNLYPASVYQPQNAITLTAQSNFVTNNFITIKSGADFTFLAGQSVDLNSDFEVEPGASFVAEISPSPCTIGQNARRDVYSPRDMDNAELKNVFRRIPVPQEKKFDITKYLPAVENKKGSNVNAFNLYPNPSKGNINIELFLRDQEKNVLVDVYDLNGHNVYSKKYNNIYFIKESLSLPSLNNGMYNMIIRTDHDTFSKKVLITR